VDGVSAMTGAGAAAAVGAGAAAGAEKASICNDGRKSAASGSSRSMVTPILSTIARSDAARERRT
jgi:hypothetical protein